MSSRNRFLFLLGVMSLVAISVGIATIAYLYDAAFEQTSARLEETVRSNARLLEAVARFDQKYSQDDVDGGAFEATLGQMRDAHSRFKGFGESGEFTLARLDGDHIVFLLSHRHSDLADLKPVPIASELAEPMRLALSGNCGTVVGLDYRGVTVLAAHEPVAVLNLGIVAKIDMAEIRAPFIRAGLLAAGSALLLVFLGTALFYRVGMPLVHKLEKSEKKYRELVENMNDGLEILESDGQISFVNRSLSKILGRSSDELIGLQAADLFDQENLCKFKEQLAARERGDDTAYEISLSRPDGRHVQLLVSPTPLYAEDGSVSGSFAIITDITERIESEKALSASLKEKEVLLKEIHLRVRNNLQIISSLLDIQADHIQDEAVKAVFKQSQSRFNSMSLIHEQLYLSSNLASVDLAEYVDSLIKQLAASYGVSSKKINLECHIENISLDIDTAVPCGLLITELVSNAFKHAFPYGKTGQVRIDYELEGEMQVLTVSDSGVGLPLEVDWCDPSSLGLQLVNMLTKQLRGTVDIRVSAGTITKIRFPRRIANSQQVMDQGAIEPVV